MDDCLKKYNKSLLKNNLFPNHCILASYVLFQRKHELTTRNQHNSAPIYQAESNNAINNAQSNIKMKSCYSLGTSAIRTIDSSISHEWNLHSWLIEEIFGNYDNVYIRSSTITFYSSKAIDVPGHPYLSFASIRVCFGVGCGSLKITNVFQSIYRYVHILKSLYL